MQESFTIKHFFEKLNKIPRLSHDDCIGLFKQNNETSKQKIAEANLRLVVSIAKTYGKRNREIPLEDLIQEGNVGLLIAIDRFKYEKGWQFSTYATYWIRQSIGAYITTKKNMIRRPTHALKLAKNLIEAKQKFIIDNDCEPSDAELMNIVDASQKMFDATRLSKDEIVGLTETPYNPGKNIISTDGNVTYEQRIADEADSSNPDFCHLSKELTSIILTVLKTMSPREEKILRLRFGLSSIRDEDKAEFTINESESCDLNN